YRRAADMADQMIGERPQLEAGARKRTQQVDAGFWLGNQVVQLEFDHPARPDVFSYRPVGHEPDAQALKHCLAARVAIVALKCERLLADLVLAEKFAPASHAGSVAPVNQAMVVQFLDGGGRSVPQQIIGRCADDRSEE